MNLGDYQHCVCLKMNNTLSLCLDEFTLSERGKQVRLAPRNGETTVAVVLDGCVMQDNQMKCDGLFLWKGRREAAAVLVELKGAGDIRHAFEQLAYTKTRPEYRELVNHLRGISTGQVQERAVIVSNGILSKPERERLEDHHGIRVQAVLYSEASSPIPELRDHL